MGPTLNHSYMYLAVYLPLPSSPVTLMGKPKILLSNISATSRVLRGMTFTEALVSTNARLMGIWFMDATK